MGHVACWVLGCDPAESIALASRGHGVAGQTNRLHWPKNAVLSRLRDRNKVPGLPTSERGLGEFSQVSKPHYSVLFHGPATSTLSFNLAHFSDVLFTHLLPPKKSHRAVAKPRV